MLQLKIRPGTRITIGEDVLLEVTRDTQNKLALRISAPDDKAIRRVEPSGGDNPPPEGPKI